MKKRLFSLLIVLLLVLSGSVPALAADSIQVVDTLPEAELSEAADAEALPAGEPAEEASEESAISFPYVLDNAGLLSDSQRSELEERAAALSRQHGCSLYIVTLVDYTVFDYSVSRAAQGIFTHYDLGWGDGRDGVILLLSMKERDFSLEGHGSIGQQVCSHEGRYIIEDEILDNFKSNDWYGGFADFLTACDSNLTRLENGEDLSEGVEIITGPDGLEYHEYNNPYAPEDPHRFDPLKWAAVVFAPLLTSLGVCSGLKSQMKTAHEATRADEYLIPPSVNIRIRQDNFTHRSESRVLIESEQPHRTGGGGGGGGSSFHSGGGFSGSSGKF